MKLITVTFLVAMAAVGLLPVFSASAQAQTDDFNIQAVKDLKIQAQTLNPAGLDRPTTVIGRLIGFFIFALGGFALVMFIWAGFLWMTAAGNADKIARAGKVMVWATLGVMAVLMSYIIVQYIFDILIGPQS